MDVWIEVRIYKYKSSINQFLWFDFRNATQGLGTPALKGEKSWEVGNLQMVAIVSVFLTDKNPFLQSVVNMAAD